MATQKADPRIDIFAGNGEIARLLRDLDWSRSPLGAPENWPQSLRSIVRMMLTSRYQMWMGWGPELAYLYNDAYRPTLGVKHPDSLARPVASVWKEIWHDIGPLIDRVLATGEAHYGEAMLLLLERSGIPEETYHTFSYSPLFDDAGAIAGLFCVVVEETERVLSERRLATIRELASSFAGVKTEADLFAVVEAKLGENLRDLPFTLTYLLEEDGRTARLAAATGIAPGHPAAPPSLESGRAPWPFEALLGSTPALVVPDLADRFGDVPSGAWDRPAESALLVPIAQQAHDKSAAGFMVVALNPYRPGDETLHDFIRLLAGQIASALASVRAYEEERRRAAALAEIDRVKTIFFSNVSHEFRTPLTLMLGPLEDLLAQAPDDSVRQQVELAHRNGLRLLRLVNSLLDFSRIEAGRVQARYEPTDLAAFTADIASNFRSAVEKAGLDLIIEAGPLAEAAYVDREMWEKIVLNLLSNAFKHTFEGEIAVRVEQDGAEAATVTIADTGVGIPAAELPRLFERFHRVESTKGRSFEGSGIGLALVQELVRLHGGSIRIESEEGAGTRAIVSLPLGRRHLPRERISEAGEAEARSTRALPFVDEALRWLPGGTAAAAPATAEAAASGAAPSEGARDLPGTGRIVILADDNPDMRDYVARLLGGEGYDVRAVADGEAALAAARDAGADLILSDVMMPGLDGFGLLKSVRADSSLAGTPVILLSARAGEEARVEGLERGADDYLVKPFSARELVARVNANIQMAEVRREANRAVFSSEQRYLMTQERLSMALSTGRVAVFEWEADQDRLAIQGPLASVFGVSKDAAEQGLPLAAFVDAIHSDDRDAVLEKVARSMETGSEYEAEYRVSGDGRERIVIARGSVDQTPEGARRMAGVVIDITDERTAARALHELNRNLELRVAEEVRERTKAEDALRQAQKMEAVGQLTGGIAHDFNNLLTVIMGGLDTIRKAAPAEQPRLRRAAELAWQGAQRAASLTERLLAFSRRQPLQPRPLDLNALVRDMTELLHRTLGETIELEGVLAARLWTIEADRNQLESAILNLALNARDAMPEGGKLTIETANTELGESYVATDSEVRPGQYVAISISDTGSGMTEETLSRVFEPFFTTKEVGRGTGLGLSMVYGFVKQSGGHVTVYSEPGEGTTVRMYFPRFFGDVAPAADSGQADIPPAAAGEVVLVVEDNDDVREFSATVLRELGYEVIEAAEPDRAAQLLRDGGRIDLLFTDVVLPGRSGRVLADEARQLRPDLKILFTTGYSRNAIVHQGRLDAGVHLLTKPFTSEQLALKVRDVLDGRAQS